MKRLTIIACCVVILGASYVFGAKTMTHTWEDIDAAITTFLAMDTAAELEALLSLQNLQGAVTDAQVPDDITINAENVSVTDTDENFTGTDAEAVLDELYDTKEPSQTPAGQAEMEAGTETAIRSMSPLRVAQAIAAQVARWETWEPLAESWLGIDPSALTPDYFLKVNDSGTGIEESESLDVDITGFSPSMVLYSDASGAVQPHPTVSSQELAQLDGYNTASGTIEERLSALSSGGTDLSITVGGETGNDIIATLHIQQDGVAYSDNASVRAWLSATDGGAPGAAFDGDSGDAWVVSDGSVLNTYGANYDELLLTGSDGDCVITMQHSDASSPATKYLCGQYRDSVSCAEVTFSADSTPCALYEDYSQTSADTSYAITSSISMYQLMKGGPTGVGVCKVRFLAYTSSAAPDKGDIHFEIWSNGGTPAQIGADSTTVEVTSTSTSGAWYEVTFASPPELDGSDWRLVWVIENWQTGLNCYWKANTNEASYESTSYDLIHKGTDQSADAVFEVYTQ